MTGLSSRVGRLLAGTALAGATMLSTATAASAAPAGVPQLDGWTTVWSDDFDGSAGSGVDRGDWQYDLGTGYPGGAGNWGTGEVETMTDSTSNVALDGGGNLAITPQRDAGGNWTSGRIETTRTDFGADAGGVTRIEARLKQPDVSGDAAMGYWPAFWALGSDARANGAANWPSIGELDIMESINGRDSSFGTLHCGTNPGGACNETTGIGSGEIGCGSCKSDFHTYAVELDRTTSPQQLRFYRDGNNYFTINSGQLDATTWNNATNHGFFPILNVAMGGGFPGAFGGGPTGATQPGASMLVDYVAVYRR